MTCGLVHASYSLPEWQAVKVTFFAPWVLHDFGHDLRLFLETIDKVRNELLGAKRLIYRTIRELTF